MENCKHALSICIKNLLIKIGSTLLYPYYYVKNNPNGSLNSRIGKISSFNTKINAYEGLLYPNLLGFITLLISVITAFEIFALIETILRVYLKMRITFSGNFFGYFSVISAIIFGLMIFIAESIRESPFDTKALLSKTFIYPIVNIFIMWVLIYLLLLNINLSYLSADEYIIGVLLTTVAVSGLILTSLYILIDYLIYKHFYKSNDQVVWEKTFDYLVRKAAHATLAKNYYLNFLDEKNNLDYKYEFTYSPYYLERNSESSRIVEIAKKGVITDINLNCMLDFMKNSSDYFEEKIDRATEYELKDSEDPRNKINILKIFGDSVGGYSDPYILKIPRDVKVKDENKIRKNLTKIFKINKVRNTFEQKYLSTISQLKEYSLEAIKSNSYTVFGYSLKIYEALINGYIDAIKDINIAEKKLYKRSAGKSNGLAGDYVRMLIIDLFYLVEEALHSDDRYTYKEIIDVYFKLIDRSLREKSYYLFSNLIQNCTWLFSLIYKNVKGDKSELFKDLRVHYRNSVLFPLYKIADEKNVSKDSIDEIKNYIHIVFVSLRDLLILISSKKDKETFGLVTELNNKLIDHLKLTFRNSGYYRYEHGEDSIIDFIEEHNNEMLFGLSAHILGEIRNGIAIPLEYLNASLPVLHSMKKLYQMFLKTRNTENSQVWGWDFIEIRGKDEFSGVGSFAGFSYKIDELFVQESIKRISKGQSFPLEIGSELDSDIVYIGKPLIERINKIKEEKKIDMISLSEQDLINSCDILLSFINNRVAVQERLEEEKIAKSVISDEIKRAFSVSFSKTFSKHSSLRNLMTEMNAVNYTLIDGDRFWGINRLEPKERFVTTVESMETLGTYYGEELAREENENLLEEILINVGEMGEITRNSSKALFDAVATLDSPIIITSLRKYDFGRIKGFENIESGDENVKHRYQGYSGSVFIENKEVPVFSIGSKDNEFIVVLDVCKSIKLEQENLEEYTDISSNEFIIDIIDLNSNEEQRKKISNQKPKWLSEKEDPEFYLRNTVILKLLQKYKLSIIDKSKLYRFSVDARGLY